jgi:hypothetical protein
MRWGPEPFGYRLDHADKDKSFENGPLWRAVPYY